MKVLMRQTTLALLLCIAAAIGNADTITIRADSWYPINGEPGSEKPGYMIEMARKILGDAGHSVDYRLMPWERALAEVRQGNIDCVVGAYIEDAPDFVYPTESWGMDESAFYVKKGETWRYTGLDSLASVKLGLIGGYAYDDAFDQYVQSHPDVVQYVKGDNALENNIKKIMGGRITATVESPLVMRAKLKDMGLQADIISAGNLGEPSDMYIACSPAKPSSKALVELIDAGTQNLRASGELKDILDNYGLTDWK